jgi:hypothetical protein
MKRYIVCRFNNDGTPLVRAGSYIDFERNFDSRYKAVEWATEVTKGTGVPFGVLETTIVVRPQERPVAVCVLS